MALGGAQVMKFLSALPALLGITGFVIYLLLRSHSATNPIVSRIVDKLRNEFPNSIPDNRLRAAQVERLLQRDTTLRAAISEQDFLLLKRVLNQQFVTQLLVYLCCAAMFTLGVYLFVRNSNRLQINEISAHSSVPSAGALLVDLDDIVVTWQSGGDQERLDAYLMNPDTGLQSTHHSVDSSEHRVVFRSDEYHNILATRELRGTNRIKAILASNHETFSGAESLVQVGLKIMAVAVPGQLKIAALIDNSAIVNYSFQAHIVLPHKRAPYRVTSFGNDIQYGSSAFHIVGGEDIDWERARMVYFGPDDRRIVRCEFLVDSTFGASIRGVNDCGGS